MKYTRISSSLYSSSYSSLSAGLLIMAVLFVVHASPANAALCVSLSADVGSGATDQSLNGPILTLQSYLLTLGYLAAVPNGHFGPATLSAVQRFQAANGISSTGYVGPLTRAALAQRSCASASTVAPQAPISIPIAPPASNPAPQTVAPLPAPVIGVTAPALGETLAIGTSYPIRWTSSPSSAFNIVLEQPGGAGAGFVASGISNNSGNQYVWNVGKAFSSQTQASQNVATGTYRIRLENPSVGAAALDQVSGWFTLSAQQLAVKSVIPASAYADNSTAIVLIGSGFSYSSGVYFDTNLSGIRGQNAYVSPDGTVLVFTIPTSIQSGPHTLFVSNSYDGAAASAPFTVSAL